MGAAMNVHGEDASPSEMQIAYAWRDAGWLVLHEKKAVLPRRCVLCDAPADGKPRKVFVQEEAGRGLLAFGFLAVVVHGVLSPRAAVKLWLCDEHKAKERSWRRLFLTVFLLAIGIPLAGVFLLGAWLDPKDWSDTWVFALVIAGLILLAASLVIAAMRPRPIRAKKIDKPFVWLTQVHPDYLARFPEVPPRQ